MKRKFLLIVFFCGLALSTTAQETIKLHSVSINRQPTGETGYTLNGSQMINTSRVKLLNTDNFGPSGTYAKTIEITDAYGASGDLEFIGSDGEVIDLFYFGSFNIPDFTNNPFTEAELDSLYQWSLNGGKMIIGGSSSSPPAGIDFRVLNEKWGFSIGLLFNPPEPTRNIPTLAGAQTDLFDGPFGQVAYSEQAGLGQGFFDTLPADAIVLAVNQDEQPVIILDCHTLDLILADGDTHNMLSGVSGGPDINNAQDTFWANTIAFMDQLEDPPFVSIADNTLSAGAYTSYQWNKDGTPINGATESTYVPDENGAYSVTVELEVGCVLTSPDVDFVVSNLQNDPFSGPLQVSPNPASSHVQLSFDLKTTSDLDILLVDRLGRAVQTISSGQTFPQGTHNLTFVVDQFPAGTYQLLVRGEEGGQAYSLIIQ